jgi:hypothetical protein
MVYGLHDPRGDDPLKLERYEQVYATFAPCDPVFYEPIARWRDPWLDRLGVRWVMAEPGGPAADPSWRLAYDGSDARIFERPGALPLVRWEGAPGSVRVLRREPGLWEIAWKAPEESTLVVAETWDRGWSAAGLEVRPVDGALIGVRLGPGEGRLTLRYRPPGWTAGAALSGCTLAGLIGCGMVSRRRREP